MSISDLSIRTKVKGSITLIILLAAIGVIAYYPNIQKESLTKNFEKEVQTYAKTIALSFEIGLKNSDFESVQKVFTEAKKDPRLAFISIQEGGASFLTEVYDIKTRFLDSTATDNFKLDEYEDRSDILVKSYNIATEGMNAQVFVGMSNFEIIEIYNSLFNITWISTIVIIIVGFLFSIIVGRYIAQPIEKVRLAAEEISKGNLNVDLSNNFKDEIGKLYDAMNNMKNTLNDIVVNEIGEVTSAARKGDLKRRCECEKFNGTFFEIVDGFNKTLDAMQAPINETKTVLASYAQGDFTIFMRGDYEGEYGELKEDINLLGESLNDIMRKVALATENLVNSANMLRDISINLNEFSNNQNLETEQVASAIEQMAQSIEQNAENSSRTSETANKNGNLAQEGGDVVKQTVSKMKQIGEVVNNSASKITKLGEASKKIGEIVSVIDEIANQTNLLALNAAIEAARAGESGKGFAVVADEVRKLAERTAQATNEIADMVGEIQSDTDVAVKAMNKGNAEVDGGIAFADNASKALDQILSSTDEVQQMVAQMAAANEQQSNTSKEISQSINTIADYSGQSKKQIDEVVNTVNNLTDLSGELQSLITKFHFSDTSAPQNSRNQIEQNGTSVSSKLLSN